MLNDDNRWYSFGHYLKQLADLFWVAVHAQWQLLCEVSTRVCSPATLANDNRAHDLKMISNMISGKLCAV